MSPRRSHCFSAKAIGVSLTFPFCTGPKIYVADSIQYLHKKYKQKMGVSLFFIVVFGTVAEITLVVITTNLHEMTHRSQRCDMNSA
jgi:hypothetical protein